MINAISKPLRWAIMIVGGTAADARGPFRLGHVRGLLSRRQAITSFGSIQSLDSRRRYEISLAASRLSGNLFSYLE
jgi:hypothetical protein